MPNQLLFSHLGHVHNLFICRSHKMSSFVYKLHIMSMIQVIGLFAAASTTIAFFPQMIRTIRTKSTEDISLPMYTLMVIGQLLWLLYGIFQGDLPIVLANGISSVASFIIFYYKLTENDPKSLAGPKAVVKMG